MGIPWAPIFILFGFTSREGLLHHRNPYAPEMTRQIQMGLFGRPLDTRNPVAPFDYRAFSLIQLLPIFSSGHLASSPFL